MSSEGIGLLLLGWLLGLLAPQISEGIRRRRRRARIKDAIYTEVAELGTKMALTVLKVEGTLAPWTKDLVNWTHVSLVGCGVSRSIEMQQVLSQMLNSEDEVFDAMAQARRAKPGTALGVKGQRLPYIDSAIGELDVFEEVTRGSILELRGQVEQFNELVEDARMFYRMTFDVTGSNHAVVSSNLNESYCDIAKKGRVVVQRVLSILPN